MSREITKDDYNHLIELYNRRCRFDVIGIPHEEHRALRKALDELNRWPVTEPKDTGTVT